MIILRRKNILQTVLIAACAAVVLLGYQLWQGYGEAVSVFYPHRYAAATLVIDAGHGGEDGGAVSRDGMSESGINLSVARRLDLMMGLFGVRTLLTRTEDVSLHEDNAKTLHQKKVSDLKNRVKMINAVDNAVLISIHQNNFFDSSLHGAQVFYADEARGAGLAKLTQDVLRCVFRDGNRRQAAKIPNSVYLMKNVTCPAILVECGFLSNPAEAALLKTDGYQTKLAFALCGAFLGYQETQS